MNRALRIADMGANRTGVQAEPVPQDLPAFKGGGGWGEVFRMLPSAVVPPLLAIPIAPVLIWVWTRERGAGFWDIMGDVSQQGMSFSVVVFSAMLFATISLLAPGWMRIADDYTTYRGHPRHVRNDVLERERKLRWWLSVQVAIIVYIVLLVAFLVPPGNSEFRWTMLGGTIVPVALVVVGTRRHLVGDLGMRRCWAVVWRAARTHFDSTVIMTLVNFQCLFGYLVLSLTVLSNAFEGRESGVLDYFVVAAMPAIPLSIFTWATIWAERRSSLQAIYAVLATCGFLLFVCPGTAATLDSLAEAGGFGGGREMRLVLDGDKACAHPELFPGRQTCAGGTTDKVRIFWSGWTKIIVWTLPQSGVEPDWFVTLDRSEVKAMILSRKSLRVEERRREKQR